MCFSLRCRAAAAVLALAAALLVVAPPASADVASDEARVLALIQQTRSGVGAPALRVDAALTSVARSWAAKMARDGTISHNVGIGSQIKASKLAENVGMGPNVDVVHQGFLNSPGHRANMVDRGVNAVGVGVAWANGTVFVVQDYAQLAAAPPPPNRAPAVPTAITPAAAAVLRAAPTQASARYSDPDGNAGQVVFAVLDESGRIVRHVASPVVCSGCMAVASFAALPDGWYWIVTVAHDGTVASAVSPASVFTVDRSVPRVPSGLHRVGGQATAVYSDPDGSSGWLYVYVFNASGVLVHHGWTGRVCSGCTAANALPALGRGTYHLFAFAYDGLTSALSPPTTFAV
jgi:hypothetical protein